ncbi:unnamed protein product [Enterobius vermicularis]|uniref:ANK_REP_REGION domain-containing protein n=1 Tax=Enterobius vermicularis TaxID=51028 RepID=A0A0N4VR29_ENTVE|nr:unnamed protein product [Enterobius vermicularis]
MTVKKLVQGKSELVNYSTPLNHRYTGLHYAAKGGHLNVARFLLREGAKVNVQTGVSVWSGNDGKCI